MKLKQDNSSAKKQFKMLTRTVPAGKYTPREDAVDIFLTDMQIHAQKATNPASLTRQLTKKGAMGKPGRAFNKAIRVREDGNIDVAFDFDPDQLHQYLVKNGKTMIRFYMPASGLPVVLAEDAKEKIRSIQKKLIKT